MNEDRVDDPPIPITATLPLSYPLCHPLYRKVNFIAFDGSRTIVMESKNVFFYFGFSVLSVPLGSQINQNYTGNCTVSRNGTERRTTRNDE